MELENSPEYQLDNLKADIGQKNNLAESVPEKLQEMVKTFEIIRGTGSQKIEQLELK